MAEDVDKGAIAFHLVMALCSDLAVHDEPRIARMQNTLSRLLDEQQKGGHPDDVAELRQAYDALLRLGGDREPPTH